MRKFCFLLVIFCFISAFSEAQSSLVGPIYSPSKNYSALGVVGFTDGNIAVARATTDKNTGLMKDIQLELFDSSTLALKSTYTFESIAENKQLNYPEGIYIWNNKIGIFTSAFQKENKTYQLEMRQIEADGKLSSPQILLTSTTENFAYNRKRFVLSVSENHKNLSCIRLSKSGVKNESRIEIGRYDSTFSEINHFEVDLPFDAVDPEVVEVLTDDFGNVHILLKGFKNDEPVFSIFAFPVFNEEAIEYQLNIPGKIITSIKTCLSREEKLLVSGLTRERFESPDKNSGVFFLRIDRELGTIEAKGTYRFDTDLLGLFAGDEKQPNRNAFEGFLTNAVITGKNNDAILIAEYFKEEERCETDYRTGIITCFDVYTSGPVLMMSFNEKGSVDWYIQLNKKQQSTDDGGRFLGTVALTDRSTGLIMAYNGRPNATNEKAEDIIESFNRTDLMLQAVSSTGQLTKLNTVETCTLPVLPYTERLLSDGNVYLLSEYLGKAALVRLLPQTKK
jgi:hypothetical protein